MINLGLQSEYILSVFGLMITNTFLTSVLVTILLTIVALGFYRTKQNHSHILFNGIRILTYELLQLTDAITQNRKLSKKILPLLTTFFLFIVTANLIELIPGFLGSFYVQTTTEKISLLRSPNSDLTTTVALALISVLAIQYFSIHALGIKKYLNRFINFTNPINFILGFFELISEGVKILSFSFRLFGNIFAGEVLLLVIAFLVPYIIPLPFMILEVFVGIIQSFIFAILTLTFIQASTMQHIETKTTTAKEV